MDNILEMPPPENVRVYVEKGRALFADHFPDQDFDAPVWDASPLKERAHSVSGENVYWTLRGSKTEPLPERFASPIKTACLMDLGSVAHLKLRSAITRMVWEHIRSEETGQTFRWADMTTEDMLGVEDTALEHWASSTTNKRLGVWNRLLELLASAQITRPMNVPWRTPRPEDSQRHTLAGREKRMKKLPSDDAIEATADIYAKHAESPQDQLISCVLAILVATGLRIGEVLSLPYDCLFYVGGDEGKDRRWMLRYRAEKKKWAQADPLSLESRPAGIVRDAVRKTRELTRSARQRARTLEENPSQATLPGFERGAEISTKETAKLVGFNSQDSNSRIRKAGIPIRERSRSGREQPFHYCRYEDVEEWLLERQENLWMIRSRGDGTVKQTLSESLFVVHRHFFHDTYNTQPLNVEKVELQPVNDFLGGRWRRCEASHEDAEKRDGKWMRPVVKSAFDRFGLTEPDGSRIEMTSHSFRHWVTTKVLASGASDPMVARWQNRSHSGDLGAYDHRTRKKRVEQLREALKSGRLRGRMADVYFSIKEDLREEWLHDHVQHVHVTDLGLCTHDFSLEPCPHHINCVKGCKHFVHDTGDEKQREQLKQLQMRTEKCLEEEKALAEEMGDPISENWVTDYERVIENIETVLEADPEEGTQLVRPFEDGESKYSPL